MSKYGLAVRDTFSCHALLRNSRSAISASALVLIAVLMTASCGMVDHSSQSNGNNLALTGRLPGGTANQAYNAVLAVSGGNAPYQFAIKSGSLPPGTTLNSQTGSISGTPTTAGTYSFHIAVTDMPLPDQGGQDFAVSVTPVNGGGIQVSLTPSGVNLVSGETQTFTATVTGTNNPSVTWSASGGAITQQGVYTAPTVKSVTTFFVTATSNADPKQQAIAAVVVEPANGQALTITNGNLPEGQMGSAYDAIFTATGGTQPYTWTMSGNLPPGLTLTKSNGQLSGMPGSAGTFNFSVTVTDAKAQKAQKSFTLTILAANGNFDGPAELPRVTVASSMADTPAPGPIVPVNAGADLQAALNNANCGDTLELQAGATFTGNFTVPAKSCDDGHWIIVRTSAPDNVLPAEGQRVTPCFAGVASLAGRPQYACNNPQKVMARLVRGASGDGPVVLAPGANHYRFFGLELTRPVGVKAAPTLISLSSGAADHIIVDRSWLHGTVQDETSNGFSMKGMNYAAIVDSYLNDFHCTAVSGTCSDSHAVGGGNGDHQDGPFKISNNFLEAAGEAVMFGGGPATVTPTDIEILRNHFFKPWQWMKGNPGFVGGPTGDPFVVKNHLELKNAIRVLVDANLMENVWGGFSQTGHGILLTPKNQHTRGGANVCPICQVTDVTIRYTHIAHAGGGMALGTIISGNGKDGGPALAGTRWSIHDVVMDDINHKYVGSGALFELQNGWPVNPLNTFTINHITGFPDPGSHLMSMGDVSPNPKMYGFVFTNNLVGTGRYPVWNTGGGPASCAFSGTPADKINNCFLTNTFGHNALIATPQAYPPSSWPAGNFFPVSADAAGVAKYDEGVGGDYELNSNSPYKNAGTDGKDLGADIVGLEAALNGVE